MNTWKEVLAKAAGQLDEILDGSGVASDGIAEVDSIVEEVISGLSPVEILQVIASHEEFFTYPVYYNQIPKQGDALYPVSLCKTLVTDYLRHSLIDHVSTFIIISDGEDEGDEEIDEGEPLEGDLTDKNLVIILDKLYGDL